MVKLTPCQSSKLSSSSGSKPPRVEAQTSPLRSPHAETTWSRTTCAARATLSSTSGTAAAKTRSWTRTCPPNAPTIFQHIRVLIYVFEVGARDTTKNAVYYHDFLNALQKYPSEAAVFFLVHEMDLVAGEDRASLRLLERHSRELRSEIGAVPVTAFATTSCYTWHAVRQRFVSRAFLAFSLPLPPSPTPSTLRVWTNERMRGRESCTPSSPTQPSSPNT
jgi:hypothetical protein